MNELFIELFSEEIPARMQRSGAESLGRLLCDALKPLNIQLVNLYSTPRRIAGCFSVDAEIPASTLSERGPRENAPEKALEGFLRKFHATKEDLTLDNGFWLLNRAQPAIAAPDFIARVMPDVLWQFPWPKSQRWGKGSLFTWVRPLHKITCLFNGHVIPFSLARGEDNGHNLQSSNITQGHHFLNPEPFEVSGCQDWEQKLQKHYVIADPDKRRTIIVKDIEQLAESHHLALIPDAGLTDEVTGLVEWPVSFLGQIDKNFMDLPVEVMQVSMRVNQRYFAMRDKDKATAAPYFAFVANIPPIDGGTLVVKGNERVLRARFADARYFWDHDRTSSLASKLDRLKAVTFHAKLGTQFERTERLVQLTHFIAPHLSAPLAVAERAAMLCKIDLVTGMVGEFPELQGIMGGYYALHDREQKECAKAISEHYMPKGPQDNVPTHPVSMTLALADKIDTLAGFFAVGEKPTGSGDPYALRRAALGVLRIIRENTLSLPLHEIFEYALTLYPENLRNKDTVKELMAFIQERLRVQLRSEQIPHDVMMAILAQPYTLEINTIVERINLLKQFLQTEEGSNLLAAIKRANNILRIENRKDGPHDGKPSSSLLVEKEEKALYECFTTLLPATEHAITEHNYTKALELLASTRSVLDHFFEKVTVNAPDENLRKNRLALLSQLVKLAYLVADFTQIEG